MTSDPPDHSTPVDTELENELDNFITLQQHSQHANTHTIHHLSQTMTLSESSNSPSTTGETRAHRVLKRKLLNTPFPSNSRPAPAFIDHLLHTNTKEFLECARHFFHNILTFTQILTTNNQNTLTKKHYFPHFHGPHTIISVTHYHSDYIIIQMIMNYVKLGSII